MIDLIKEALGSPAGSASFVLAILVLTGWIIHYATKFATRISIEHGQLNERIDKTESSFDKRMDKIESNIDEIRKDTAYIKGAFEVAVAMPNTYMKRKSPLMLTDLGREIAEENNLNTMVVNNWSKIDAALRNLKTKNPYDIQEFCLEVVFVESDKFFSPSDIEKLKLMSFKTGIPLFSIARIIGLLIRDKYFSENDIDVGEVDKFDPSHDPNSASE